MTEPQIISVIEMQIKSILHDVDLIYIAALERSNLTSVRNDRRCSKGGCGDLCEPRTRTASKGGTRRAVTWSPSFGSLAPPERWRWSTPRGRMLQTQGTGPAGNEMMHSRTPSRRSTQTLAWLQGNTHPNPESSLKIPAALRHTKSLSLAHTCFSREPLYL